MADPTPYVPSFSFSGYQATTPSKPLPGPQVDNELANVAVAIASAIGALGDIRRSDGQLKNGIVTPDSVSAAFSIGFTMRGAWVVGQNYIGADGVAYAGGLYKARIDNTAVSGNAPGVDPNTWAYLFSIADIAGAMSTLTYDPQNIAADAFARANHTGTQAIATIVNLASSLAALLPLAGGVMTGDIDLGGHNLLNVGARTGQIFQTTGLAAPTGSFFADGSLKSRTTYARLWAFIANGTGAPMVADGSWSANPGNYSSGDGSTTFRVPDLRGMFSRGADMGRGVDASRAIGSYQNQALLSHGHNATSSVNDPGHVHNWGHLAQTRGLQDGTTQSFAATAGSAPGALNTATATTGITVSTAVDQSGGAETRPVNIAYPFCIYY